MDHIALPVHLRHLTRIVADEDVADSPMTRRVRERLAHLPFSVMTPDTSTMFDPETDHTGHTVYLKHYKGRFLRPCPATRKYRCCAYQIIHFGENCPVTCTYCILKAYFRDNVLKIFANQDDLFGQIGEAFSHDPNRRFRVGTGEFTDSLALEAITSFSRDLVSFLHDFPNVRLELKSKIIDLSWMDAADPKQILPAWSVNAPSICENEEFDAASLAERLQAAATCAEAGFHVCLHFDPIIHFPGWEHAYDSTVDMIFDHLKPESICYVSLGSFRCLPELFDHIQRKHPESHYIYNEFTTGEDGKKRLLRTLRAPQLHRIASRLIKYGLDKKVYLCMESDVVWNHVFGYVPSSLGGLANHLMKLAFNDTTL
ncbi:SPL family radical SAM protein [Desulfovibrio inopinatus]|uniref:SPL family radical SAM protein n=1 Tax=Desulfovibrio inopinatus TaxID=102109 RepID=UPI0004115ADC|nr:radical SAM protein [Desulfovibrio inopinatus]